MTTYSKIYSNGPGPLPIYKYCSKKAWNGLIQVEEEGWTGFSKGWQGCSEGFAEGEAWGKSRGAAVEKKNMYKTQRVQWA